MKKKNIFIGIVSMIVFVLTFSFNISRSDQSSDISFIQLMANASLVKDDCDQHLEGYFCNTFVSGDKGCMHGGEVGTYCDD